MEESAPAPTEAPAQSQAAPVESSVPAPAAPISLLGGVPSEPAPIADVSPGDAPATNQTPIEQSVSTEPWFNKYGDQYKDNQNITKYATEEGFLDGHLSLVKKIGAKSIEMPDENASQDDWNAFYSKTGRPESVDNYSEYKPEITVDEAGNEVGHFEFDPDGLASAKKAFFESGQSDKQVQANLKVFADISTQAQEKFMQQRNEEAQHTAATLKSAFGADYESKMKSINAVVNSLGLADDIKTMGLSNNLMMIRAMNTITEKMGESTLTGDVSPAGGGFDARMEAIKNSAGYRDKGHHNYQNLQNQRNALYLQRQNR